MLIPTASCKLGSRASRANECREPHQEQHESNRGLDEACKVSKHQGDHPRMRTDKPPQDITAKALWMIWCMGGRAFGKESLVVFPGSILTAMVRPRIRLKRGSLLSARGQQKIVMSSLDRIRERLPGLSDLSEQR